MRLYAPWERAFKKIATPFEHFIHAQTTSGILLLISTILALILANSCFAHTYEELFNTKIDFNVGSWKISQTIHYWINDGLMAIFFFIIGLEIKREILTGELSSIKIAILPILAAIGGMIFPALIYITLNAGSQGFHGWGIPMATDIAFAITILILLRKHIPVSLVTFLVALAIVDDIGAVMVIAIFYTDSIYFLPLILAGVSFLILLVFNRLGIRVVLPYFLVGLFMWFFMLQSGVHATIAGVIAAFAIPSKPKQAPLDFTQHTKNLLEEYDMYPVATDHTMHEKQKAILRNIKDRIDDVTTTSARLERELHLPVVLAVIPLFALANAGITIDYNSISDSIAQPVSLGVIFGLLFGKVFGIFGISYLAIKLNLASLPEDSTICQLFGVALLGGIGFTMSIFISELAFINNPELMVQAKIGILFSSLTAGLFGYIWLKYLARKKENCPGWAES